MWTKGAVSQQVLTTVLPTGRSDKESRPTAGCAAGGKRCRVHGWSREMNPAGWLAIPQEGRVEQ